MSTKGKGPDKLTGMLHALRPRIMRGEPGALCTVASVPACILGASTVVVSLLGLRWTWIFVVAAMLTQTLIYTLLVFWNPKLKSLLAGLHGPSGAVVNCGVVHEEAIDWDDGTARTRSTKVDPVSYYAEYHGHPLADLVKVHQLLRQVNTTAIEHFV